MPKIAICPYCLSDNLVPLEETGNLFWKRLKESIMRNEGQYYLKCQDCVSVFRVEKVLIVESYPADTTFELTDAGRAAIQAVQA